MTQALSATQPKVLIVEDEALVQMTAADVLTDAGFDVLEASNADEALGLLEERADEVGVLFTDVHMPGSMDGIGLAERVHQCWPHILLLITSGHWRFTTDNLPDHGVFMAKPYATAVLLRQLYDLTQQHGR